MNPYILRLINSNNWTCIDTSTTFERCALTNLMSDCVTISTVLADEQDESEIIHLTINREFAINLINGEI